ncbi:MAG: hypothetical protein HS104_42130 [Polyangiaceae bacterium]|nr:hypothetical protein [Polyangiaceae bacterium]MCL4753217.1 hypothetical protein [Myxococcales bacterium]
MAKPVKKRRATAEAEASLAADPRLQPGSARGWSSAQVLGVLCVGLAVGGFGGYTARGSGKTAQSAAAPAETVEGPRVDPSAPSAAAPPPAAGADKFGRPPGDEHFGHDHPPGEGAPGAAPAPAPAPAPGPDGKDSFGREPGNEHFGHNHQ